jgi:alanine dehydrogenase
VLKFAQLGVQRALEENRGLAKGINTRDGVVTNVAVAKALSLGTV